MEENNPKWEQAVYTAVLIKHNNILIQANLHLTDILISFRLLNYNVYIGFQVYKFNL